MYCNFKKANRVEMCVWLKDWWYSAFKSHRLVHLPEAATSTESVIICGCNIKYGSQDKRCPYGFTEQNMIALISCIVAQTKDRGQQDGSALATNHTLHARHSPSFVQTMSRHGPCWGPNLQQLCDLLLL